MAQAQIGIICGGRQDETRADSSTTYDDSGMKRRPGTGSGTSREPALDYKNFAS
ncbi:hypothetical protein BGZ83_006125, partial [Gryganskiella cystojenkinii]